MIIVLRYEQKEYSLGSYSLVGNCIADGNLIPGRIDVFWGSKTFLVVI